MDKRMKYPVQELKKVRFETKRFKLREHEIVQKSMAMLPERARKEERLDA